MTSILKATRRKNHRPPRANRMTWPGSNLIPSRSTMGMLRLDLPGIAATIV